MIPVSGMMASNVAGQIIASTSFPRSVGEIGMSDDDGATSRTCP